NLRKREKRTQYRALRNPRTNQRQLPTLVVKYETIENALPSTHTSAIFSTELNGSYNQMPWADLRTSHRGQREPSNSCTTA
ncbi:hypothetical protein J6590_067129, partial [Homalodisca vitripennis]